ncbi:hypothetical protein DL96DRAFT_1701878 [Flagelloscypha sp. PMI_526]|nr:hypothetical protein DL96DRAFT_1701878 [Flagelloscypha sp. PMI_526]
MESSGSPGFIPPLSYNLVILGFHGFLYGLFLVLSILSSIVLVLRHQRAKLKGSIWLHPLFAGGLVLTIFVTVHWILSFVHGVDVILKGSPTLYYSMGTPQSIVIIAMVFLSAFLCDLMIIYRLWMIYDGARAIVAFPVLTVSLLLVTGPGIIYELVRLRPGETMYKPSFFKWIPADGVFSMCTNLYCTSFVSFRIWKAGQPMVPGTKALSSSLPKRIIPLLSQSAILYTGTSIFFYITFFLRSPLQWPLLEVWPPVSGISFMLLSTHVAMSWVVKTTGPRPLTSMNFGPGPQRDDVGTMEFGAMDEMLDSIAMPERGLGEEDKTGVSRTSSDRTLT